MPTEHECIIGLVYKMDDSDLVTLDGLKNHIEDNWDFNKFAVANGSPLRHKVYTIPDYADGRKATNMRRFAYCPDCGRKIDWKQIRRADDAD